jgi:hypothetical protein
MSRKPENPTPGSRKLLGAEDADDTNLKRPEGKRDLRLPHERDEAPDPLDSSETTPVSGPRQVIEQAASDLSRGLVDTDRHGTPSDVPAPGPAPEESPGAEVPDEAGLDRKSLSGRGEKRNPRPGKDATHT